MTQFRELRNGSEVYVFDRKDGSLASWRVSSVSVSHVDGTYPKAGTMVVDVTIESNGASRTYTVQDSSDTGYAGTAVVCTGKKGALREVEACLRQTEATLDNVGQLKQLKERCETLITELNPLEREWREMESWKSSMEQKLTRLTDLIEGMAKN